MNYIYGTIPEDAVNITYTGLTTESTTTTVDNINRTIKVDTNFDIADFLTKLEASNTYLTKEEGGSFVHKGTLDNPSTELIYGTKVFPRIEGGYGIGFSDDRYGRYGYGLLYGGFSDLNFKIYGSGPARFSLESSTHGTMKYGHTSNSNYTAFISSSGGTAQSTCGSGYIVFPAGGTEGNPKVVATLDDIPAIPTNYVTTDTEQDITASKRIIHVDEYSGNISYLRLDPYRIKISSSEDDYGVSCELYTTSLSFNKNNEQSLVFSEDDGGQWCITNRIYDYETGQYYYAIYRFPKNTGTIALDEFTSHATYIENGSGTNSLQQKGNTASGNYSFAEGIQTFANGNGSHAEGYNTTASGEGSHAEGFYTIASGNLSHAGGLFTNAKLEAQTVIGKYNADSADSLFIVGNGTNNAHRSNAFEVLTDGTVKANNQKLTSLCRHHFDVVLTNADLALIPAGMNVSINVNALSTSGTSWQTLSELDGGGFIVSAFGTIPNNFSYIFELKLFYASLGNGTLLLNIHDLTTNTVKAVAITTVGGGQSPNTFALQDSTTPL